MPGGWSIGVEVVFYSLWPLLMWSRQSYFRVKLLALALLLLAIAEFTSLRLFGTFAIVDNSYLYYWPPTQLPVILTGCAFYFTYSGRWSSVPPYALWVAGAMFVVLSTLGLLLGTAGRVSPGLAPTVLGLAFCCVALLTAAGRFGIGASRWLSEVGVCSYSIYLVHFAALHVARLVLHELAVDRSHSGIALLLAIYLPTVAISYYLATWTRRWIELPGIEIGRRLSLRLVSKPAATYLSSQEA